MRFRITVTAGLAAILAASLALPAQARQIAVAPGAALQPVIDGAAEGDVIILEAGTHQGPVTIDRRLTLQGESGAILQGNGRGSVVTVTAAGSVVRGLTVRGSGKRQDKLDSGIFLAQTATEAVAEDNTVEGNLYGIYIHGAADALVRGNRIHGIREGRMNEAGNGVSVWNAPGARVLDNEFRYGRDGIFVVASKRNVFSGNRFGDLRFAVHYMYTNDSEITDNVSIGNSVGFAIMYSHRLLVARNLSDGDRDHGFLFNYANGSRIVGNTVRGRLQPADRWIRAGMRDGGSEHGVPAIEEPLSMATGARIGPTKCVFIYNANQNRFYDNRFEGCEIGIHFTAGSERNALSGNAFIRNRTQVKYVGTRYLDWSENGRGNYWSDNPAFDLNGDGIADTAYRPNDLVDKVLWTAPQAKLLINSPAVQVIRWAQSQFPALLPGGVVDSRPLMAPPSLPQLANREAK